MTMLKESIKPISYIKSNAAEMIRYVNETKNPIIITQNGEAKAVVVDIDKYQQTQNAFTLLNILKLAERDVERGRVKPAKQVFDELEERHKQLYGESNEG